MKALVGSWDSAPHKLLAEITSLRTKVAQLKAEIEDLRAENVMLREMRDPHLSAQDISNDELASTSA
ncbi:MAG: hypothetical protein ACR2HR_00810 [Euzebya sp.]